MSPDLSTTVGAVALRSPVMTAAGTSGYGDELAGYGDLAELGAVVVKSLAAFAWEGNAPPRVGSSGPHMINSVGLAGPGVDAWRAAMLPRLLERGATVVGSIWGRTRGGVRRGGARDARGARRRARGERELSQPRGPLARLRAFGVGDRRRRRGVARGRASRCG